MPAIRTGISGWRYAEWRGVFYPSTLPQRRELEFAARHFDSIEINGSFYSLQRPESYRAWYRQTPEHFVFAVKGSRFITHMKKLRDVETPLANFFASGVLCLEEKLGPFLWQFPNNLAFDSRFEQFFAMLPQNTRDAARLASKHDGRLDGRSVVETSVRRPIRHAVEVRSKTCQSPAFIALLRKFGFALVVADTAGRWPYMEDVTADFVYVRLHGATELYRSEYSEQELVHWADRVRLWSEGTEPDDRVVVSRRPGKRRARDVYVYFDNDVKVHAPFNAMTLAQLIRTGRAYRRHTA